MKFTPKWSHRETTEGDLHLCSHKLSSSQFDLNKTSFEEGYRGKKTKPKTLHSQSHQYGKLVFFHSLNIYTLVSCVMIKVLFVFSILFEYGLY